MRIFKLQILLISLITLLSCNTANSSTKKEATPTKSEKNMSQNLIRPPYLKKGDTIMIVAPAGVIKTRAFVEKGKKLAESWGLKVIVGDAVFKKHHHFAATDENRLKDLQKGLDDPSIKAVWSARGGYGTVRIVDDLDFTKFKENPKWIVGFSDITVLHNKINQLGYETLHAMMPVNLMAEAAKRKHTVSTFKKAIFGEDLSYTIPSSIYNKEGQVSGELVGGNLSILYSLVGTPLNIDTKDKIVFIEEVGEYLYHIDRMMITMDKAGFFKDCKGVIVGDVSRVRKNNPEFGNNLEQIILEIVEKYNIPVCFDFPAGHEPDNRAIFMGRTIDMNVTKQNVKIQF
ncbi:LD-carboxypeptidase [Aureivirga sp. CE67]|uniref:S66 peptidase family protein n=1 Tax=Aureivirga sp. CE67 TaxID=1788983 RepID=UPI0018C99678|nr:LD-carboxypeptidase [Aureivirga sp. CE67]